MQELIERMREYVDRLPESFESRGMHDILLAMEERMETLRCHGGEPIPEWAVRLLERA